MKQILINELKVGMFVEKLDRPWIETPYLLEGILIQSQADIDTLAQYCKYVYITQTDPPKKDLFPKRVLKKEPLKYKHHVIPEDKGERTPFHGQFRYETTKTVLEELPEARKAHQEANALIDQIQSGIDKDLALDIKAATKLVEVITSSVIRNPEALMLVNEMNPISSKHFEHALKTATHLIAFGRRLCLSTVELGYLGLGGLLMDIGQFKVDIDDFCLSRSGFQKDATMRDEHVKFGEQILATMPGIPKEVLEITAQHHEREDGSGYPRGLCSNQISTFARMAAIVDSYDKMVTKGITPNTPPATPYEAITMLWDWSRHWLNPTLVQQFAHCIGLFPVGSLIELNTGEVAIVLAHHRIRRLSPKIMIVLDADKKPYESPLIVDLSTEEGKQYEIVKDLGREAYGINPKDFYI